MSPKESTSGFIDLHVHTTASDGLLTPQEVVDRSVALALSAIAITDHDTLEGVIAARAYVELYRFPIDIVAGIELSCEMDDSEVHILGYFVDLDNLELNIRMRQMQDERRVRGERMVAKLNSMGVDLKMDTVLRMAKGRVIARPHVADALLREEYVYTFDEAFQRYLGYHAPAYVPKMTLSPEDGIRLIHSAGGLAVLAHPGTMARDDLIPVLVDQGLDGMEVFYAKHSPAVSRYYKQMARHHNLIPTGGSDCHGPRRGTILLGNPRVPYSVLERLEAVWKNTVGAPQPVLPPVQPVQLVKVPV